MIVDAAIAVLGASLLLLGLALATVGLYGMLRKRDIFEQLHAAGLVTGPGVILVLLASLGTGNAEIATSALLVVAFVLVTSSLSTHTIALAAWRRREGAAGLQLPEGSATVGSGAQPAGSAVPAPMRILVAHDGSLDAAVAVELVAGLPWPQGSLVRLVGAAEGDLRLVQGEEPGSRPVDETRAELSATLEGAARHLERPGLNVERVVRRGSPASAIVGEARDFHANLVVMGNRGLGRVRSLLAGSVASEVLDRAPCPVLVARSASVEEVLLAVDGSAASAAATDVVARWPIFDGTRVQVLGVAAGAAPGPEATADPEATAAPATPGASDTAGQATVAEQAARRLRAAGRQAAGRVETGEAAARIVALAAAGPVDLIVLGSRGRTGLRRALLGSVARDVFSATTTSVLVVRAPRR